MGKPSTTGSYLFGLCSDIAQLVDNIVYETQGSINIDPNLSDNLLNDVDDLLALLNDIRTEILDLGDSLLDGPENRGVKQQLANACYDVERHAKELIDILKS